MTTPDSRHWASRQPAKQDEVRDLVARGIDYVLLHRRETLMILAGLAVAGVAGGLFAYSRTARENDAWEKLAMAEAYAYYGKAPEAQAALDEVAGQTVSGSAAALASLLDGQLRQAKGEHDQALAAFARAADAAPEALKPFALAERAYALERAGKHAECAAAAQSFADANGDHFLAPSMLELQGRCLFGAGQKEAAKAAWQKLSLQFPETPWAARANARLQPPSK